MQLHHRTIITGVPIATLAAAALFASPALAQKMEITLTVPQLKVAEYHKPYVAVWIEKTGAPSVRNLAIWYDFDMKNNEGTKWLRDVRQWWRVSGRSLKMPADGITGATRAPGSHKLAFANGRAPLGGLDAGNYVLIVEAAREVGGREVVKLPFAWPPKPGQVVRAAGTAELGAISLAFPR